jgi:biopolymer transport protein ExbB
MKETRMTRWISRLALATVLVAPTPAMAGQGFGSIFFYTLETAADGAQRIEWVGSGMIWLLVALSMVNLGMIGTLWIRNRRPRILPERFAREVEGMLADGRDAEALRLVRAESSDYSLVLRSALEQAPSGRAAMLRSAEQAGEEAAVRRFRRLEMLNVLGQVSPMLGLFGTVYGMIAAFQTIAGVGGNADPVMLASGIGTALVTTFWGLLIAIPALSAYAAIRNGVDACTLECVRRVERVVAQFKPAS